MIEAAVAQQSVSLPARLAPTASYPEGQRVVEGADTVVALLRVFNFLGASSEPVRVTIRRAATPIPTIRISAPPLLEFRSDSTVGLTASAAMASCVVSDGASTGSIAFNWTLVKTGLMPGVTSVLQLPALTLDAKSRLTSELTISGSTLNLELRYTLRVTTA